MLIMHEETLLRVCELAAEVIYAIFAVVSSVLLLVWKAVWTPINRALPRPVRPATDYTLVSHGSRSSYDH